MNTVLQFISNKYIDLLLQHSKFRIDDTLIYFYEIENLINQYIVYNTCTNEWVFKEIQVYPCGDQEFYKTFKSLEDLITNSIIPFFYCLPDSHIKNIFILWLKNWKLDKCKREDELFLKFIRGKEYFSYPVCDKGYYNYVIPSAYDEIDVFTETSQINKTDDSKYTYLKFLLDDTYHDNQYTRQLQTV